MIKTIFKFLLCVIVYNFAYLTANAILPFSKEMMESGSSLGNIVLIVFTF